MPASFLYPSSLELVLINSQYKPIKGKPECNTRVHAFQCLIDCETLYIGHSLKSHTTCQRIDESIADHASLAQLFESGNWAMAGTRLSQTITGRFMSYSCCCILLSSL